MRSAHHADGGGALGRTSLRHPVPRHAAPALHRPRRRSGRRRGDGHSDRPGAGGPGSRRSCCRHGSGTSTRICGSWASMHFGQTCGCRSCRRTSPASWSWRHRPQRGRGWRRSPVPQRAGLSASLQGRRGPRPRPSERAIGRQAVRTGNGGGRLFSVGGGAAFTSRDKIVGPSPSSADASALRFAAGAGPARPPPSSP